jgi:hypothetical protein
MGFVKLFFWIEVFHTIDLNQFPDNFFLLRGHVLLIEFFFIVVISKPDIWLFIFTIDCAVEYFPNCPILVQESILRQVAIENQWS